MGFLNISVETDIHTSPKTWGKWIFIVREKYGETKAFQLELELELELEKHFKIMGFLSISD